VSKKFVSDHAFAVTKAAVQLVPSLGGLIASLIDDYAPTSAHDARRKSASRSRPTASSIPRPFTPGRTDVSLLT
jgi:hypothetical protein